MPENHLQDCLSQINKTILIKHRLKDYRNFNEYSFDADSDLILITGRNGSGKTNILESISYLSPGKGIRSSGFDVISRDNQFAWQTESIINSKIGFAEICAKFDQSKNQRTLFYNGSKISSNELAKFINIIWLTPQMNGIFLASRSDRIRFLDRIVFSFFRQHSSNINKLDHFHSERLKHLTNNIGHFDESWLKILELKIIESAFEVDISRRKTASYIQDSINALDNNFPKAAICVSEFDRDITYYTQNIKDYKKDIEVKLEHEINKESQIESEGQSEETLKENFYDNYLKKLREFRLKDAHSGRSNYGAQKVDFLVTHQEKSLPASLCSTGEQKSLLISLFIAQVNSIIDKTKATPILLLDELFVHLDDLRKELLTDYIMTCRSQCFITSTDDYGIERIAKNAKRITL